MTKDKIKLLAQRLRNGWSNFSPPQKVFVSALLLGIFSLGFLVTYLTLTFSKVFVKNPGARQNSFSSATTEPINQANPEKGVYSVLLLGYGGAGHEGALLTDSIIVIHVNTNAHSAALISIPRDLWVTGNHKINEAGLTNGFANVGPVVQSVTGLPINYFVSVDFGGFTKIIDDLGGISVQVPKTLDDPFYPILGQENNTCSLGEDEINALKAKYSSYQLEIQFTCRYEHLHFDKGPINLDGATALKFVRSRHGDSDFARSLRQFAVLIGIENKLISLKNVGKLDTTIDALSNIVRADLTPGVIKSLIQILGDPGSYKTTQIQLTTDNVLNQGTASDGEFILFPKAGMLNFTEIKNYINGNL